jgi:uncharacterized protein YprB with RNaseH-like and TPR domain
MIKTETISITADSSKIVYFDVETSGFGKYGDFLQMTTIVVLY